MLNEKKYIDQLFREKLGEYEKPPPVYVLTNIKGKLNAHRKEHRFAMLKALSVAAAIVIAFLAGWWMTNPTNEGDVRQNSVTEQRDVKSNVDPSANVNTANNEILSVTSNQDTTRASEIPSKVISPLTSNLSSLATFAANTSFVGDNNRSNVQKSGDLELFNTEKEFLDELHQNFKIVKKLTDWIATVKKDSIAANEINSLTVINHPFSQSVSDKSGALALNTPVRNNGRWSIKAEFAPVFNNQGQFNGSKENLISSGSQNYKPQETTAENTFSGGMIAGYKVGKRLIVKSGFVYNNIRQTTRNVDLMGVNALYNVPGNANLALTPAGKVNLDKMVNTRAEAVLNSSYQLDNSAKYSAESELKQDIGFIEIPVQATYKLIDRKIAVGLTGGISTNILVGNKAILSENGKRMSSGETANMRSVVYSGAVGVEIGYEITKRITLTVEPRLKHFVNSLSTSKSVNYKPSQIGIVTGLTYSFN